MWLETWSLTWVLAAAVALTACGSDPDGTREGDGDADADADTDADAGATEDAGADGDADADADAGADPDAGPDAGGHLDAGTDAGPACGDGRVDAGEACDDGPRNSDSAPNACRTDCTTARCGDGVRDAREECDDGPANSDVVADACRVACVRARCGDGVVDLGEACDDGPDNDDARPGACRTSCRSAGCGDGVLDDGEVCDDGVLNSDEIADRCRRDCQRWTCGDGVIDSGEACDDGNVESGDGCEEGCRAPACRDGIFSPGELCYPTPDCLDLPSLDYAELGFASDLEPDGDEDVVVFTRQGVYALVNNSGTFEMVRLLGRQGNGAVGLLTDDFDDDADVDVILRGNNSLWVSRQAADGTFGAAVQVVAGLGSIREDAALGDLDGDGDRDIVIVADIDVVQTVLDDGDGAYVVDRTLSVGGWVGGVAVGDLNGDGRPDLAVTQETGVEQVVPWIQDETGAFAAGTSVPVANRFGPIVAADLDADGDLDLAATAQSPHELMLLANDGAASFTTSMVPLDTAPYRLSAGDVDGDGDVDLGVGGGTDLELARNDGAGSFMVTDHLHSPGPYSWMVVRDFDADGVPDLVSGSPNDPGVCRVSGDGDGTFYARRVVHVEAERAVAADLDGSGSSDLAGVTWDALNIWRNDGTGLGGPVASIPLELGMNVDAGDMDADGDQDLAVVDLYEVYVLLNDGIGAFSDPAPLGADSHVFGAALIDLEGDGDLDVAACVGWGVSTFTNDGAGGFAENQVVDLGQRCGAVTIADIDADGDDDVAAPLRGDDGVLVAWNDGLGAFTGATFSSEPEAQDVRFGYLDGDGWLDMAAVTSSDWWGGALDTWMNDGQQGLVDWQSVWMDGPRTLAIADVDRDGANDAIVEDGRLIVLRNDGDGLLSEAMSLPGEGGVQALAVDLDGDGDLDLAETTSGALVTAFADP